MFHDYFVRFGNDKLFRALRIASVNIIYIYPVLSALLKTDYYYFITGKTHQQSNIYLTLLELQYSMFLILLRDSQNHIFIVFSK